MSCEKIPSSCDRLTEKRLLDGRPGHRADAGVPEHSGADVAGSGEAGGFRAFINGVQVERLKAD